MAWLLLLVAGVLEIAWAIALKLGAGPSRPGLLAFMLAALAGSMVLLARAMRDLPVGTAYAVWTGIGAAGAAMIGMAFLGEPVTAGRLACLALVVAGILGLRLLA